MTPNDIEILIHCYCCPVPHPRLNAPAVIESIAQMIEDGLLTKNGKKDCYEATEKGAAHIRQLCNLPYPRNTFLDFNGNEIKD